MANKKKKVFKKDVTMYKSSCRDAHDEEGTAICTDWQRLKKENKELRADKAEAILRFNDYGQHMGGCPGAYDSDRCECGFNSFAEKYKP